MQISLLLMQSIFVMALMAAMAFVGTRVGVVKPSDSNTLSAFSVYIITPCMLLTAFQLDATPERIRNFFLVLAAAIAVHLCFYAIIFVLKKLRVPLDPVQQVSMIYTNAGYLILPLVTWIFGAEYTLYACGFMLVQTIMVWSHAVFVMSGSPKVQWKKIVTNPNVITVLVSAILFLLQIRLPEVLMKCLSSVGNSISPISMFVVGILMAQVNFKEVFRDKRAWLVCLGRLIVFPFLVILVYRISGISVWFPATKELFLITMLATCSPSASVLVQIAQLYDRDAVEASVINVMTTLFCILTMPLMVFLYQVIIP